MENKNSNNITVKNENVSTEEQKGNLQNTSENLDETNTEIICTFCGFWIWIY